MYSINALMSYLLKPVTMKASEIRTAIEKKIASIAKVETTCCICSDLICVVTWDGSSSAPFENLRKVFGDRAYDFEVDVEEGYEFAGCLLNLNEAA